MSIRIGILGYGNLGRGVECAIKHNPDLELVAVFTRRAPETVKILTETAAVYSVNDAEKMKDKIDVLIICGGSATDLPKQTPEYAKMFNVIDSFDTHARIPEHFDSVDAAAKESGHIGIISVGWDPGMFSLNRMYANAILTNGNDYTFWGKGVSQGHSDAVRRIKGVKDAKQYTIPVEAALEAVRNGENPELTTRQKHTRECFVVAEEGADLARIENEIKTMPNYFDEYDTKIDRTRPYSVVSAIKTGIRNSTHMLCLLSQNALDSKWIPWEVGYGYDRTTVVGLTLKEISQSVLPEYLQIVPILRGTKFISNVLKRDESTLINERKLFAAYQSQHPLDSVLNWEL